MAIEAEAHPTIPADWGRAVAAKVAREIRGACGRMADRHAYASDEIDDACDAAVTAVMQVLAEAFTSPDLIHRSALAEDTARAAEGTHAEPPQTKAQSARKAPTWDEAVTLARRAIYDTDGRGMIARNRNYLQDRVAREILKATRALTTPEHPHGD